MASTNATARIRKRWFCLPALLVIYALLRLRFIKDEERAARWLADHAMFIEVT